MLPLVTTLDYLTRCSITHGAGLDGSAIRLNNAGGRTAVLGQDVRLSAVDGIKSSTGHSAFVRDTTQRICDAGSQEDFPRRNPIRGDMTQGATEASVYLAH